METILNGTNIHIKGTIWIVILNSLKVYLIKVIISLLLVNSRLIYFHLYLPNKHKLLKLLLKTPTSWLLMISFIILTVFRKICQALKVINFQITNKTNTQIKSNKMLILWWTNRIKINTWLINIIVLSKIIALLIKTQKKCINKEILMNIY